VELVAECANGFEAVKAVAELKPDVLILDVQMPKLTGFEVLELVGRDVPVIFATAYDEYALRAFEVHAVDYLLKPYSGDRLKQALAGIRARLSGGAGASPAEAVSPATLVAAARAPEARTERVVIRDGVRVHVLPVEQIDYVEAQDDYVSFVSGEKSYLKE